MPKKLYALLMLAILVVGLKYYHDSNQAIEENPVDNPDDNDNVGPPFGGVPGGPPSPVVTPPDMKLGIYWNSSGSDVVENVDWGTLSPGGSKSVTLYLKNEGDAGFSPSLSTSNWVLKDENGTVLSGNYTDYFSLTWDYNNMSIQPQEIISVRLTLSVSYLIKDVVTFAFDIIIGW